MSATAGRLSDTPDRVDAAALRGRPSLLPAIQGRISTGRPLTEAQLLQAIRRAHSAMELANRSDQELRETLNRIQATHSPADPEAGLVETFAITDETLRRRLGYWRIFAPDFDRQGWERYFQLAESCPSDAAAAGLADDERLITETLRRVLPELSRRYAWDILLPAEFYQALARRDTHNRLQFRPTDEQILAGLHLFRGKIVELKAGEGKTVAAAFPAIWHALKGRAVHIATANDYLAARDCELLAPVYRSLGLSVDHVLSSLLDGERRHAYRQPIVYGTLREFGFDWLRDNLKTSPADQVHSRLDTLIIDEVDQALIDEARAPLIIAGAPLLNRQTIDRANQAVAELVQRQSDLAGEYLSRLEVETPGSKAYAQLMGMALLAQPDNPRLRRLAAAQPRAYRQALAALYPDGSDYPDPALAADLYCLVDPEQRFVTLTAQGLAFLESRLGTFYAAGNGNAAILSRQEARRLNLANQVYQLLRAYLLLQRDADYIVAEDGIILLDRVTGRPRPDSRYQEGLHPALEAKEGVAVHPDCEALAQISVQGLAQTYRHLSGMTGTAGDAAAEFQQLYHREVVVVPAAHPLRRRDLPSRVYSSQEEQLAALADTVRQCQRVGQPVLVGVQTVAHSALVSRRLWEAGVAHNLLNAVTGPAEAEILRQAGAAGAVTVATNMAGRGADILLDPTLNQRLTANVLSLLQQRLAGGETSIVVQCPTAAEADLLAAALLSDSGLAYIRRDDNRVEFVDLIVSRAGCPPPDNALSLEPLEFGLGLYVISAAFSPAARLSWQLKGRSGRQGQFGATRFILSWEDPLLAYRSGGRPSFANCQKMDAAGRVYFQGKAVERYLYDLQETAETDAAARRSVQQDYAAIADAHTAAYYQTRQQLMTAADDLAAILALIPDTASRLVNRHFPGGDVADYPRRFSQLAKEVQECYGIDTASLYAIGLEDLLAVLAALLSDSLTARQTELGCPRFNQLARLLRLQSGDEMWKDYRAGLQALSVRSRLGGYGPKSAVADYIIHAAAAWRQFQGDWADFFLSRLCTFPLEDLAGEPAPAVELDDKAAALLH